MKTSDIKNTIISDDSNYNDPEESETISEKLINIVNTCVIKKIEDKNDNNNIYGLVEINGHVENILLNSIRARQWLQYKYYQINGKTCSKEATDEALDIIASEVRFSISSQKETIYNRIAMVDNSIYYDMCYSDWSIIQINKDGWKKIPFSEDTPIFERKQQQLPQVEPILSEQDGLNELCNLLRIKDEYKMFFKIHIIAFFIEKYPIPIMIFSGDQGSIKTTLMQTVKLIVDPSAQLSSRLHKKMEDISIHLYNRYMSAFDNITNFNTDISNLLCRVITGEGDSKRKHYTNLDEVIMNYRRKIILNGISPSLDYPDLIDRAMFYETSSITENERMTLDEFEGIRKKLLPVIIYEIFDILSKAISCYDMVKPQLKGKLQRMSDFSIWGECISRCMGNENMLFLDLYKERIKFDSLDVVNTYPIFSIVQSLMDNIPKYEEQLGVFYEYLKQRAFDLGLDVKSQDSKFPRGSHRVREQLKILRPTFRELGLDIQLRKNNNQDKNKGWSKGAIIINIKKIGGITERLYVEGNKS